MHAISKCLNLQYSDSLWSWVTIFFQAIGCMETDFGAIIDFDGVPFVI